MALPLELMEPRSADSSRLEGFPGGTVVKKLPIDSADTSLIPELLGRSPEEGNGNPLQYSCLGNPTDRGSWGGLQSVGSQRVGYNLVTKQQ